MFQAVYIHFTDSLAATVSINQNLTGLLGSKDTHLTCSFFLEKGEQILSVQIIAKNITEDFDDNNIIAIFKPEKVARTYLADRVTLTNITNISINATLTFNVLKHKDEKDYMCKIFYYDKVKDFKLRESETTRLSVKVQTRHVNVNKQPNLKQYDRKTDQINLTCTAIGNPEPEYIWFKQDNRRNILSTTNTYVIEDVNRNNSGIYICEAFNIIDNIIYKYSYSVAIDILDYKLLQTESESSSIFVVHTAYAISFSCAAVVVVLCFAVMKRHCKRDSRNIHSEVSENQENISEDNAYEEIGSVSYQEVNLHNDMIETSNQPITEDEIILESILIPTCTSSSESNVPLSHLYVNTNIVDTNEGHKMSGNTETIPNQQNGLENCNIMVENIFVSDNSESDTLVDHQYVNMTGLRVLNVYEDLNHTTADTQNYESLNTESNNT